MNQIDVVVVSFNSSRHLRDCVQELAESSLVSVVVVDNASTDDSLATIADLPVQAVAQTTNGGFGHGCNTGWHVGNAPYVLFLNPDARIGLEAIATLAHTLDEDPGIGIVGPQLRNGDGGLARSIHRFPRVRSTFSEALYLHHLWPMRAWSSETVQDVATYELAHDVEWLSGACLLVRREVLEQIGGFDEAFFMYGEDIQLCRSVWGIGSRVRYEPSAVVRHVGGASAPRPNMLPILARSRFLYVSKNCPPVQTFAHRVGLATESITHALVSKRGWPTRRGHLKAFRVLASPQRSPHGL